MSKTLRALALGHCFLWTLSVLGQVTNPSRSFGPGACGPADPAYIHTAEETGGIPMFLQRSEAAKSMNLMRGSLGNNVETVLWAKGVLDGSTQAIQIPVDSETQ